jgi:hypothetical protein
LRFEDETGAEYAKRMQAYNAKKAAQTSNTGAGAGNSTTPNRGVGRTVAGNAHAHDTAIALRVLDLQLMYPGAWITANQHASGGADLVCWNCAAKATHGAKQEVWVWEFKAVQQSDSTAYISLNEGIEWAKASPLKAKNAVVVPGERFPHESSSVVPNNPDEIVTVYSESNPNKQSGVEWYEVKKYKKPFALSSPEYKKGYEAHVAAIDVNNDTEQHRMNLTEPGLVEDKVSGWAFAGGVGVVCALGGWALAPAAPAVVAVVGVETLRRSMVELVG